MCGADQKTCRGRSSGAAAPRKLAVGAGQRIDRAVRAADVDAAVLDGGGRSRSSLRPGRARRRRVRPTRASCRRCAESRGRGRRSRRSTACRSLRAIAPLTAPAACARHRTTPSRARRE